MITNFSHDFFEDIEDLFPAEKEVEYFKNKFINSTETERYQLAGVFCKPLSRLLLDEDLGNDQYTDEIMKFVGDKDLAKTVLTILIDEQENSEMKEYGNAFVMESVNYFTVNGSVEPVLGYHLAFGGE